jgi:UPF0755 protein
VNARQDLPSVPPVRFAKPPPQGSARPIFRWSFSALAIGILLLGAALIGGRYWFLSRPVAQQIIAATEEDPAPFRVERGESFETAAARLEALGWIPWSLPIRLEARLGRWDRRVYPGYYKFRRGESVGQLLARFREGEIERVMITIPEGRRLSQILPILAESTWNAPEEFEALAQDREWLEKQGIPGPGLEGYIFPETYEIALGESPQEILRQVTAPAVTFWNDSLRTKAEALGLTASQTWALASIIESEAVLPEERRRISGVFWNRLRLGMRLESDPTVLYALGRAPGRVLYVDLEVASPYNTYRTPGLPPGAICQPGRASLLAAVDPVVTEELFFVARGNGSHVFSKTLAEHNRARAQVRSSPENR